MIAALSLWVVALITWTVLLLRFRALSLVLVGALGLTVYSIPALFGVTTPVLIAGQKFQGVQAVTPASQAAMALAWTGFLLVLLLAGSRRWRPQRIQFEQPNDEALVRRFVLIAICASVPFLGYAAWKAGPLFFLGSREEAFQVYGYAFLLWRWVNVLGLMAAVAIRARGASIYFLVVIIINFLMGDRTVITLGAIAVLVMVGWRYSIPALLRNRAVVGALIGLGVIVLFGKIIYTMAKAGDWNTQHLGDYAAIALFNFEPMIVHYLLQTVIDSNVRVSLSEVIVPTLGQFLIVPSAFGIDSAGYNGVLTNTLFPTVTYGIAFNFWAQGYSLMGYAGVLAYGVIFGAAMVGFTFGADRTKTLGRCAFILCGAIFGIYAHRNSLENIVATLRQPVLAFAVLLALAAAGGFRLRLGQPHTGEVSRGG